MNSSPPWKSRIEDYLTYRHTLGFALTTEAAILRHFAQYAEQAHHPNRLTTELATRWARTSKRQSPLTWGRRIEVLRGFAQYWQRFDSATEIPARTLFGAAHRRLVPHIYTDAEIATLLTAAQDLLPTHGLRPATCHTVFGLLAATGLRISEAIHLTRSDVDLQTGVLTIREAKFHKSRFVPVHPSVRAALKTYTKLRDQRNVKRGSDCFFVLDNGKPPNQSGMLYALHTICRSLGWQPRGDYPHHRLQDMRHTFIVRSLLRTYQQNGDVERSLMALSTYVGHVKVTDTYWYLTGIPELMAIAVERFHDFTLGDIS